MEVCKDPVYFKALLADTIRKNGQKDQSGKQKYPYQAIVGPDQRTDVR